MFSIKEYKHTLDGGSTGSLERFAQLLQFIKELSILEKL